MSYKAVRRMKFCMSLLAWGGGQKKGAHKNHRAVWKLVTLRLARRLPYFAQSTGPDAQREASNVGAAVYVPRLKSE